MYFQWSLIVEVIAFFISTPVPFLDVQAADFFRYFDASCSQINQLESNHQSLLRREVVIWRVKVFVIVRKQLHAAACNQELHFVDCVAQNDDP